MTQVTEYTTTDAIRSSLGIDAQDVSDSAILDSNLQIELETDLQEWLPDHATLYSEGGSASATDEQKLKKNYLVLYSQYFCAYQLALRPLFFPQIVSDGKNQLNRFSDLEPQEIVDRARANMDKFRTKLDELHNSAVSSEPNVLAVSVPDYDPVTNQ